MEVYVKLYPVKTSRYESYFDDVVSNSIIFGLPGYGTNKE